MEHRIINTQYTNSNRQTLFTFILKHIPLILLFLLPTTTHALQTYHVDQKASVVQFKSKAPLSDFIGKTNNISGWLEWNPKNLAESKASFSVQLATLDTGNRLRNKHMREKFLQTSQYPEMRFDLSKVISKSRELLPDTHVTLDLEGRIFLHGIEKVQRVTVIILHDTVKNEVTITGSFPITLSDYKIKQPSFLGMFVENTLPVTIHLVLK